jgi:hypothetical protein
VLSVFICGFAFYGSALTACVTFSFRNTSFVVFLFSSKTLRNVVAANRHLLHNPFLLEIGIVLTFCRGSRTDFWVEDWGNNSLCWQLHAESAFGVQRFVASGWFPRRSLGSSYPNIGMALWEMFIFGARCARWTREAVMWKARQPQPPPIVNAAEPVKDRSFI